MPGVKRWAGAGRAGFSVIREYGGHGIGRSLHMPPVLSFHPSHMPRSYTMEVGHTFTIEPMIACTSVGCEHIIIWP
jgi:methionine aminopeptidase